MIIYMDLDFQQVAFLSRQNSWRDSLKGRAKLVGLIIWRDKLAMLAALLISARLSRTRRNSSRSRVRAA